MLDLIESLAVMYSLSTVICKVIYTEPGGAYGLLTELRTSLSLCSVISVANAIS